MSGPFTGVLTLSAGSHTRKRACMQAEQQVVLTRQQEVAAAAALAYEAQLAQQRAALQQVRSNLCSQGLHSERSL